MGKGMAEENEEEGRGMGKVNADEKMGGCSFVGH